MREYFNKGMAVAGVEPQDFEECMKWAFGDDYDTIGVLFFRHRWDHLHPECKTIRQMESILNIGEHIGRYFLNRQAERIMSK